MKKNLLSVEKLIQLPKQISSNWKNTFYAIMSIMVLLFSNTINAQSIITTEGLNTIETFSRTTGTSLGAPFQTNKIYNLNDYIYGTETGGNVNIYRVSTAGTSTATAPTTYSIALFTNGATFTFQSVLGAATQSWTCPAGVTSIEVQAYGAGGAGGAAMANAAGFTTAASPATRYATAGGGGGGSKVTKTISVVPGTTYNVIVGLGGTATGPTPANGLYGFSGGKSGFSGPGITTLTASGGTGGTGCSTGTTKYNPGGVLGGVYGFSVTSAGSGYTTPEISLSTAGATTPATTGYIAASGVFSYVGAKTQGIGYTSIPTVSVTGGTGATILAYANLNINSTETGVTAIEGGSGGNSDGTYSGDGSNNFDNEGGGAGRTSIASGLNGNPATAFGAGGGGATTANFWNETTFVATGGGSGKGGIGGNGKVVITYATPTTMKTIENTLTGFKLSPNPSKSNSFNVVVPQGINKASLTVSNLLGQKLYSQNDLQSGVTTTVNVSNVKTAGVYLVSLTSEGKTSTTKWIVE